MQVPSVVRLSVAPLKISSLVKDVVSLVSVGTIWRPSASVNEFEGSVVVQSKEPGPKPPSCTSWDQTSGLIVWKSSSRMRQY